MGIRYGRAAVAALIAAGALTALAGCSDENGSTSSNEAPPGTTTTTVVTTTPATPAPTVSPVVTNDTNAGPGGAMGTQADIADAVSRKIVRNTQMTGSRVNVVVNSSGIATLTGFAQNAQQRALAEKAARDTSGVNGIKDKLTINPTGGIGKTPSPAPPRSQRSGATTTNVIVVPGAPAASSPQTPPPPTGAAAGTVGASSGNGSNSGSDTGVPASGQESAGAASGQ